MGRAQKGALLLERVHVERLGVVGMSIQIQVSPETYRLLQRQARKTFAGYFTDPAKSVAFPGRVIFTLPDLAAVLFGRV